MLRKLAEAECRGAIADGDFAASLLASAPFVAIVLTQSWCPQWAWMRSYLQDIASRDDTAIYWIEYDHEPFYVDFLEFKEGKYGNREIPYVRYYRDGVLQRESNFIDRRGFERLLRG